MSKLTINSKSTKGDLLNFINQSTEKVKDANLLQRVKYAVDMATKDMTKVTKADLTEMAQEILDSISNAIAPEPVPVENSVKPTLKTKKDKKDKKDKKASVDEPAKSEPANKETKKDKKAENVQAEKPLSEKSYAMATIFPAEIEHKELGKLVARHDMTFEQFKEAINKGETLYIATYWTKRHLKQFDYALTHQVTVPKNGFPLDLDLLVAIIACDKVERIWTMSSYTEALFQFEKVDFDLVEDKDVNNNLYTIRVSNGLEFEVYAPAK